MKVLYRSKTNKVWLGLLGGLGEYAQIDPTILRLAFLAIVVFSGLFPGLILYLLGALITPEKPVDSNQ